MRFIDTDMGTNDLREVVALNQFCSGSGSQFTTGSISPQYRSFQVFVHPEPGYNLYSARFFVSGVQSGFLYSTDFLSRYNSDSLDTIFSITICPELDQQYSFGFSEIPAGTPYYVTVIATSSNDRVQTQRQAPIDIEPPRAKLLSVAGITSTFTPALWIPNDPSWGNSSFVAHSFSIANWGGSPCITKLSIHVVGSGSPPTVFCSVSTSGLGDFSQQTWENGLPLNSFGSDLELYYENIALGGGSIGLDVAFHYDIA